MAVLIFMLTNPNLMIFQAVLMSPNYQGPGRWIIFDPADRKCFLATGKNQFPPILKILLHYSNQNKTTSSLEEVSFNLSEEEKTFLVNNKLLLMDDHFSEENHSFLK